MGTHPIFESDFDCLTNVVSWSCTSHQNRCPIWCRWCSKAPTSHGRLRMDPKQAKDGLRRTSLFLPLRWSNRQQLWQLSYGTDFTRLFYCVRNRYQQLSEPNLNY